MRENHFGRRLVAFTAALCTLGALVVTPAANAKSVTPAQVGRAATSVLRAGAKATGTPGVDPALVCPIDKPGVADTIPAGKNIAVFTDEENAQGLPPEYKTGLTEALEYAATLTSKSNVNITILRPQAVPTLPGNDKDKPNTLDITESIDLDGSGCELKGQLNFVGGSEGSTIQNVKFANPDPSVITANIISSVKVSVTNNTFYVPNAKTNIPLKTQTPVGVVIQGGTGSVVSDNLVTSDSDTSPAHEQDQGVRLINPSKNTTVSNNVFDVPVGVNVFRFSGTGTISGNTFNGEIAVADSDQSNPAGLTYLGNNVYGQTQDVQGNTLNTALPYKGITIKSDKASFAGTSFGVHYLNSKDNASLGWDAVYQGANPTRIPTRANYVARLYKDQALNQKFSATDMTANLDLYVQWVRVVHYNLNGVTGTAPVDDDVAEGATGATLRDVADQAPQGKTFLGWSEDSTATTATYKAGATFTPTKDETTLYAIWSEDAELTYDANAPQGATATGSTAATPGVLNGKVKAAANGFAVDGYEFTGWNTKADGSGDAVAAGADVTLTAKTVTLYAQWKAKTYTVEFQSGADDATGKTDSQTFTSGTTQKLSVNGFSRNKHEFSGWKVKDSQAANVFTDEQEVDVADLVKLTADPDTVTTIVLVAQWDATTAKITYKVNLPEKDLPHSGDTADTEGLIGQSVEVAENGFQVQGYYFVKWTEKADGSGASYDPAQDDAVQNLPKSGVTLYAQWERYQYINYLSGVDDEKDVTGSTPATQGKFNEIVRVASNGYKRAGYSFVSWNTLEDGKGTTYTPGQEVQMPQDGLVLYAQWSRNSGGGSGSGSGSGEGEKPAVKLVDVHRLYNLRSGEHFYTTNMAREWVHNGEWRYEGIAFRMSPDTGVPVYRLFDPTGMHLFTTSAHERDVLIRSGWRYEGVPFRVPEGSGVKVHRLYNYENGDHLLTTNPNEYGFLITQKWKWRDEKIAFTGVNAVK